MALWDDIGAGGYSALNSVLMGLPDFIVKTAGGSKALENLREKQAKHKLASDIGNVAGLAGSLFIPGGAILKGAGAAANAAKLAKVGAALTKAGQFAGATGKGAKLGETIGRGALLGAEQAIPRAIIQGGTTGDWGQAAQDAAFGTALGGGVGALGRGLGKVAGKVKPYLANKALDVVGDSKIALAGSMGIKPRAVRATMRAITPGKLMKSNKLDKNLNDTIENINFWGKEKGMDMAANRGGRAQEWIADVGNRYDEAIDQAIQKSPTLHSDIVKALLAKGRAKTPNAKAANQVAQELKYFGADAGGIGGMRNYLNDEIMELEGSTARTIADTKRLGALQDAREALESELNKAGGETMRQLGKEYKAAKAFHMSEYLDDESKLNAGTLGSPTFEKKAASDLTGILMGLGGAGAAGSSVASDISQGKDIDLGGALAKMAAGSVAGAALTKGLPKLMQTGLAKAQPALEKIEPALEAAAKSSPSKLDDLFGFAAQQAPKAAGASLTGNATDRELEAIAPTKPEPEAREQINFEDPAKVPIALQDRLDQRLEVIRKAEYPDVDPAEFKSWVGQMTDNFDKSKIGAILFDTPEEVENYNRQIQAAKAMEGIDLARAMKGAGGIMGIGRDEEAAQMGAMLENAMLSARAGGDVAKMTAAARKEVKSDIEQAKKYPELLPGIMAKYGLDYDMIKEMGIV
jgi:hypothetical protein